jgi:uncharacterized protein (TIGR03663 family)
MKGPASFACIVAAAALLRFAYLDNRPMHCDEAVHAVKFGHLLEQNHYRYDPYEYHGPTLNFLTLPVAWSTSAENLSQISEGHLRVVPALAGLLLVVLPLAIRREFGPIATGAAAWFTAISPAMVFFSRYYIQEMLLVTFTFAAVVSFWRWLNDDETSAAKSWRWIVLLGVFLGLMHATKETAVISAFGIAVAVLCMKRVRVTVLRRASWAALVALLVAFVVSGILYSSFLREPRGWLDSYLTYYHYATRAVGQGSAGQHVYPWYQYLRVFFWWQSPGAPIWSQLPIALLALVGCWVAFAGRQVEPARQSLIRFLAVYTFVVMLIYAVIPYKTPWCGLGFFHGLLLLAGAGVDALFCWARSPWRKAFVGLVIMTSTIILLEQSVRTSFQACDDPRNPYVYAHPTAGIQEFARQIHEIALAHPENRGVHIQVICPDEDYWPLPWYFRDLLGVGWHRSVPESCPAPLIITQPAMAEQVTSYLYHAQPPGQRHLYVPFEPASGPGSLRPFVLLEVYLRLDLWNAYQRRLAEEKSGAPAYRADPPRGALIKSLLLCLPSYCASGVAM